MFYQKFGDAMKARYYQKALLLDTAFGALFERLL
jgi:hypothetical protein